jgi:hypothetical protein
MYCPLLGTPFYLHFIFCLNLYLNKRNISIGSFCVYGPGIAQLCKYHCALANCGGVEFLSLDRRIYDCELQNEKNQHLIQVRSEFPLPTSKLVA